MRLAIDARYIREKPSGIGVYVQAIVDRLPYEAPSDEFVFWANPLAPRPLSRAANTRDVIIRPLPNSPWPLLWPRCYASFHDLDVFHSPHNLLPRGLPCATVVTVQDVMAIDHPGLHLQGLERLVKSAYYRQAVWRALQRATRLIVPTVATADRVRALVPDAERRVRVIWLAPDPRFRPPHDPSVARRRAMSLIGTDAPYFLVVGANSPTKRHGTALAAFAASAPRPWRLVLLQRQGARSRLTRLARRLDVEDRVTWLPRIDRDDVVTLIQAAGALIQPSVYEGFGLPIVEAMASGCPVVASDIAPFREVTRGAAVLVPPDDVARLGSALRGLAESPAQRRSLAEQGLLRAREFSWDRCARETLAVYRDAANEGGRPRDAHG